MKLGLVTDFYFPWIGGPSAVVRNLGHGLAARGHSVSLLAPSPVGPSYRETDGPMQVTRARTTPSPFGHDLRVSLGPWRDVSGWLDETAPDVVHVHHPFPLSAAAVFVARRRGIPILATNHTIPECSLWGIRRFPLLYRVGAWAFGVWLKDLLHRCTAVATPTLSAAEALHAIGYQGEISPVSNGVDTKRFRPGPCDDELRAQLGLDCRPIVLYTGRLDAEKEMDVWLRAGALLSRQIDIQLLVGGQGTSRASLETLAASLGISDRVTFMGYLDDELFPRVYRLADVYFITSRVELQSISTLEAVASGLPVVAVRSGALPELVYDGENGYLVAPGQPEDASRALERILTDDIRRQSFAAASRKIGLRHDLQETILIYEQLLERAASNYRGNQHLERASAAGY